jgi:hypothetical protein
MLSIKSKIFYYFYELSLVGRAASIYVAKANIGFARLPVRTEHQKECTRRQNKSNSLLMSRKNKETKNKIRPCLLTSLLPEPRRREVTSPRKCEKRSPPKKLQGWN